MGYFHSPTLAFSLSLNASSLFLTFKPYPAFQNLPKFNSYRSHSWSLPPLNKLHCTLQQMLLVPISSCPFHFSASWFNCQRTALTLTFLQGLSGYRWLCFLCSRLEVWEYLHSLKTVLNNKYLAPSPLGKITEWVSYACPQRIPSKIRF